MSSRKEQKEQARAEREARERRAAATQRRERRIKQLVGLGVAAVAIVAVAIVVSGTKSSSPGIQTGTQAAKTASQTNTLLSAIKQEGDVLGDPTAPVTMTYFGDLQCPVCRDFTLATMPKVIAKQVRTGRLRVRYRALETATSDPKTFVTQQAAALAAGTQGRMWQFVELFYHQQGAEGTGYVTDAYLQKLAKQIDGLDLGQWNEQRASTTLTNRISADRAAAVAAGATATPTLVITGPHGTKTFAGNVDYGTLASAIDAVAS